jgi:hypothetical protein
MLLPDSVSLLEQEKYQLEKFTGNQESGEGLKKRDEQYRPANFVPSSEGEKECPLHPVLESRGPEEDTMMTTCQTM